MIIDLMIVDLDPAGCKFSSSARLQRLSGRARIARNQRPKRTRRRAYRQCNINMNSCQLTDTYAYLAEMFVFTSTEIVDQTRARCACLVLDLLPREVPPHAHVTCGLVELRGGADLARAARVRRLIH